MDGDSLRTILFGLSVLTGIASLIYTWASNRQRASQQELNSLRETVAEEGRRRASSVGELRDRVTRVEAEVDNLPNHSQMSHLTQNIQEVKGDVGGVRDVLNALGKRIERIDDFLLNERGKK